MPARIYPSNQDTSTTARGSVIINCTDFARLNTTEFLFFSVNGTRVYSLTNIQVQNLCVGTIRNGDSISFTLSSSPTIGFDYSMKIYRIDYTTDDTLNNGITTTLLNTITSSNTGISNNLTVSVPNIDYNFEYLYELSVT